MGASGLGADLQVALSPWRKQYAVHDPAKVLLDLALTLALGGEHLADVAVIRAEPALYGLVASDPTISRTIDALATEAPAVLKAINGARAKARARAWAMAGKDAPDHGVDAKRPVIIDLDATLVGAHSEKEQAARTWKKGFGFHP
ncbi:MAG: transposase, partial [Nocardioides sp.]|nr:transposase [Nocardioides sp.]